VSPLPERVLPRRRDRLKQSIGDDLMAAAVRVPRPGRGLAAQVTREREHGALQKRPSAAVFRCRRRLRPPIFLNFGGADLSSVKHCTAGAKIARASSLQSLAPLSTIGRGGDYCDKLGATAPTASYG
jgi:hypothetical protein